MYIERITTQGNEYLTRAHLTAYQDKKTGDRKPYPWWPFKTHLYLHIFSRPDEDRVFHDHPWNFFTIILWGGYDEESHILSAEHSRGTNGEWQAIPSGKTVADRLGWLSRRYRPATHCHRITRLHTRRVVTLVLRRDRHRDWGFWCPPNLSQYEGMTRSTVNNDSPHWLWVYWREYLDQKNPEVGEQY